MRHLFQCIVLNSLALICTLTVQAQDKLVIFVQPGRSISQDFTRTALPSIQSFAQSQGIAVKLVDATKGAPESVTQTPAIFLQNGDEFTRFEGRYRDMDQLASFVHANGAIKKENTIGQRRTVAWNIGRTTLAAHYDIEPLAGNIPTKKFELSKFMAQAEEELVAGMVYLKPISNSLAENSRSFFMEFRPERREDKHVIVHMTLYSEFDMENPLFQTKIPSGSTWEEWELAFQKAGKRLEAMLIAQVGSNENGDGFEPVKTSVPVKPWHSLVEANSKTLSPPAKVVGR